MQKKKKPDKRLSVILAASELFSQNSFHDVKLEDIAEKAGVGKGTIYTYFSSKDDLFVQCLLHDAPAYEERIEAIIGRKEPFADSLRQLVAAKYESFRVKGPLVKQIMILGPQLKIKEEEFKHLIGLAKKSVLRMGRFFQRAIDSGILDSHLSAGQMAIVFDKIFDLNLTFSFFNEPTIDQEQICQSAAVPGCR
jgi:TetR/AcrR family fatty acid metabolism transcriptional regulator